MTVTPKISTIVPNKLKKKKYTREKFLTGRKVDRCGKKTGRGDNQ